MSDTVRVAVVEEHEIFRRGLVACLSEDPALVVRSASSEGLRSGCADVAVVSSQAAGRHRFDCPLIVFVAEGQPPRSFPFGNLVAALLCRASVTSAQLHATVRAAAAGLRVSADWRGDLDGHGLGERGLRVLRLLAEGRSTQEIARDMCYSTRTIKKDIHELEQAFDARSRSQVVARAIRHGLI